MSTNEIENEVVSLSLDQSDFQRNAENVIRSIDGMKKNLNFSDTTKQVDALNKSIGDVNVSPLGQATESVKLKFNALYTIADQVMRNLTNKAMYYGERIAKALTIQGAIDGFNEYELKMNSVQTIVGGVIGEFGSEEKAIAAVTEKLNELNNYADRTIYSFSDMTNNIGKFTNAGVSLDKSVAAIQGVANVAAASGANAQQASHAMYNFAQALSSGYIKLIDWKSIENATMATVEFKQQLIDTAVELKTLEKQSDGTYKVLTKNASGSTMKDVISATKNFNDSLAYQWMTSDVLTKTLERYSDTTTEIGAKAAKAATQVKTWSQLIDTLKEAIGSGWAQTWETVIGGFGEAREVFTYLSDTIGGVVGKISDARNAIVTASFGNTSQKWLSIGNEIENAGFKMEDFKKQLISTAKSHNIDVSSMIKKEGDFDKTLNRGWLSTKIFNEALDKLGESAGKKNPKAIKKTQQAIKGLKTSATSAGSTINSMLSSIQYAGKKDGHTLLFESLKNALDGVMSIAKSVGKAFSNVFSGDKAKGIYGFVNGIHSLSERFKYFADNVFPKFIPYIEKVLNFFKSLWPVVKTVGSILQKVGSIIWNVLVKAFERLKPVLEPIKKLFKSLSEGLSSFLDKLLGPLKKLGPNTDDAKDSLSKVTKTVDKASDVFETFKDILSDVGGIIHDFATSTGDSLKNSFEKVKTFVSNIKDWITEKFGFIKDFLSNLNIGEKIKEGFSSGKIQKGGLVAFLGTILGINTVKGIKAVKNFGSLVDTLKSVFGKLGGLFDGMKGGGLKGLLFGQRANPVTETVNSITNLTKYISQNFKEGGLKGLINGTGSKSKKIIDGIEAVAKLLKAIGAAFLMVAAAVFIISRVDLSGIGKAMGVFAAFIGATAVLMFLASKFSNTMESGTPESGGKGIKGILASLTRQKSPIEQLSKLMISIGAAFLLLAIGFKIIAGISWPDLGKGAAVLGAIVLVSLIMEKIGGSDKKMKKNKNGLMSFAVSVMLIAVALKIFVSAIKSILDIDPSLVQERALSLNVVIGLFVGLMLMLAMLGKLLEKNSKSILALSVSMILVSLALSMMVGVLNKITKIPEKDLNRALPIFLIITGVFAALMALMTFLSKKLSPKILLGVAALLVVTLCMSLLVHVLVMAVSLGKNLDQAMTVVAAVSILFGVMVAALVVLSLVGKKTLAAIPAIIVMTLCMALLMGVFAIILSVGKNLDQAILVAASIAILMGAMAVSLLIISLAGPKAIAAVPALIAIGLCMALIMGVFAVILIFGKQCDQAITVAAAIAILMGAMAVSLLLISLVGPLADAAIPAIITMSICMALIMGVFALILIFGKNCDQAITVALAIAILLGAMAVSLAIMAVVGPLAIAAIPAILVMTICVALLMGALGLFLTLSGNVDQALPVCIGLSILLLSMSASLLLLSAVGAVAAAALVGIAVLDVLIIDLGAVLIGLGALFEKFPALGSMMETGIQVLITMGEGLGSAIGTFIAAIGNKVLDMFARIPEILGDFVDGLQGFADAMVRLQGMNVGAAVLNVVTMLKSFKDIGKMDELATLGNNLKPFSEALSGLVLCFNPVSMASMMTGMATLKMSMNSLTDLFSPSTTVNMSAFTLAFKTFLTSISEMLVSSGAQIKTAARELATGIVHGIISGFANSAVLLGPITVFVGSICTLIEARLKKGSKSIEITSKWMVYSIATGLVSGLAEVSKTLKTVGAITDAFIKSIGKSMKQSSRSLSTVSKQIASDFIKSLVSAFKSSANMSSGASVGQAIIASVAKGFNGAATQLMSAVRSIASRIGSSLRSAVSSGGYTSIGLTIAQRVASGINSGGGVVASSAGHVLSRAKSALVHTAAFVSLGRAATVSYAGGLGSGSYVAYSRALGVMNYVKAAFSGGYSKTYSSGYNLVLGLANGMYNNAYLATRKAYYVADQVVKTINARFKEKSPSREMIQSGKYLDEGLAIGLEKSVSDPVSAANNMAAKVVSAISGALDMADKILEEDSVYEPIIRPVLDMSDLDRDARIIEATISRSSASLIEQSRRRAYNANAESDESDQAKQSSYTFTQNNYSPKALSQYEIYKNTRKQFRQFERMRSVK